MEDSVSTCYVVLARGYLCVEWAQCFRNVGNCLPVSTA